MAEGRFDEALKILKEGAKANKMTLPSDEELVEMMESIKVHISIRTWETGQPKGRTKGSTYQYDEVLSTKCFIKTFEPTPTSKGWHHKTVAKVLQLITGHAPFRHHFRHWNPPDWDTDCRVCFEAEENAIHLVAECPALNWSRKDHLGEWTKAFKQPPTTPEKERNFLHRPKGGKN